METCDSLFILDAQHGLYYFNTFNPQQGIYSTSYFTLPGVSFETFFALCGLDNTWHEGGTTVFAADLEHIYEIDWTDPSRPGLRG